MFLSSVVVTIVINYARLDGYWKRQNTCVSQKIFFEHLQLPAVAAQFVLTLFDRAVLRIKKELEVTPTGKVRSSP
jgi:hypothetical protein